MGKKKKEDLTFARKFYKIISVIADCIMIPVIVISVFCCFVMFNAKRQNLLPNILGYSAVTVVSGSMEASGFEIGNSVIVRTPNPRGLKKGDIIAFYNYTSENGNANPYTYQQYVAPEGVSKFAELSVETLTGMRSPAIQRAAIAKSLMYFHQIVDIRVDVSGNLWFKTWGTSNANHDSFWIKEDFIIGVYTPVAPVLSTILSFVGTTEGIIWLVIIPIAVIMFLLILEFIDNWDKYDMEDKVVKGEIYLTDKSCIQKNVGYEMNKKNKLLVLARAPIEYKQTYINLMWHEDKIPKGLVKHIKKQAWGEREEQKIEDLKIEAEEEYLKKPSAKIIREYQKAVEQYNEMSFKLNSEPEEKVTAEAPVKEQQNKEKSGKSKTK